MECPNVRNLWLDNGQTYKAAKAYETWWDKNGPIAERGKDATSLYQRGYDEDQSSIRKNYD